MRSHSLEWILPTVDHPNSDSGDGASPSGGRPSIRKVLIGLFVCFGGWQFHSSQESHVPNPVLSYTRTVETESTFVVVLDAAI